METVIIEEISKGHKTISRHKFQQDSITIGRGYHNDIIVSDPHVCPEHISLEHNGEHWVAFDQESVNGSFLDDSKASAHQHIVRSGDIISIGNSQVRIVFPNHPVAESIRFSPVENFVNFASQPWLLTTVIALFSSVIGYLFFLGQAKEVTSSLIFVRAIGFTLMFALWPFGVALVSHLTKNNARVFAQLGVSFIFFNLWWLSDLLESLVAFNFSSNWPIVNVIALVPIAASFGLFWFNCYVSFHMSPVRRNVIAAGLTILFFGGNFLIGLSKQPEFNPNPEYNATVLSPAFLLTPNTTAKDFVQSTNKLFDKARAEAQKEK